jgi:hypothetical protein
MSPPNGRKKLTERLLGTTYEREDLMRQEARARPLPGDGGGRRDAPRKVPRGGHSRPGWADLSPTCGGASNPPLELNFGEPP